MLAFTPETDYALRWFSLTHQQMVGQGFLYWVRSALPAAGGVGDQDALLMSTIDYVRHVKEELASEELQRLARQRAARH